jgi:hypothetical protein
VEWELYTRSRRGDAVTRVFILSGYGLFSQGVEALLRQEADLELVGHEASVEQAIAGIEAAGAEVVILDSSDRAIDPGTVVARLLGAGFGNRYRAKKVIGLSLEDNTMCIYYGEKRRVSSTADLMAAIGRSGAGSAEGEKGPR